MTQEVIIKIEGRQIQEQEEPIITTAHGTYHLVNGRHYVRYEEILEDSNQIIKNTIKVDPCKVILTKKLAQTSEMVFDLNEKTQAAYQTPYGNFVFDVKTSSILLKEEPEKIVVSMEYSLSADSSPVSENCTTITITSI